MIKRYPGGRLSGMLGNEIESHSRLRLTGPYGAFHLRRSEAPILMVAGGSGMAPVLGVLRQLAAEGCERPVRFYYGAREERDLFALDEIARLGERLEDFRFIPVTGRFVHEAISEELDAPDVYMCGPPPMLDAVQELLVGRGVDPGRIFADRFTTSAEAAPDAEAPSETAPASERDFAWFTPAARRATLYEDVTVDTQPSIHRHLTRGWPLHFADGRGTWNDASTALRSSDWFAFRDPGQQWERPYYQAGAAVEHQIEGALRSAAEQGLVEDFDPDWVAVSARAPADPRLPRARPVVRAGHGGARLPVGHGGHLRVPAGGDEAALGPGDRALRDGSRAAPRRLASRSSAPGRSSWPTRPGNRAARYLERLAATADWAEVVIAANLCFEPVVATLIRRELGTRAAAAHGDTVTPVLARVETQEWEWTREWTVALSPVPARGPGPRGAQPDGARGLGARLAARGAGGGDGAGARWPARSDSTSNARPSASRPTPGRCWPTRGCRSSARWSGYDPPERESARAPVPSPASEVRPGRVGPAHSTERPSETGSYDYVGIVMAKSAEGDAVAAFMGRREGIEVREQPAFWDIRARDRLVIPYERGLRGARLRDRRVLHPARDVDTLRADGRHRRCPDAVLGSDRGDGAPAVVSGVSRVMRALPGGARSPAAPGTA